MLKRVVCLQYSKPAAVKRAVCLQYSTQAVLKRVFCLQYSTQAVLKRVVCLQYSKPTVSVLAFQITKTYFSSEIIGSPPLKTTLT